MRWSRSWSRSWSRVETLCLFIIIAWLSAVGQARAGDREAKKVEVGWEELRRAAERHPAIRAHHHKIARVKSEETAAGAVPNPELEASAGYGMAIDGSESRLEWGIGLAIPLDWLGKRRARVEQKRAEVRAVEAEREALRLDVLLELRLLFWELLYSQEQVSVLREMAEHAETLAETVASRVKSGEVRPVESAQARLEVERIAGELLMARAALKKSQGQLALWLKADPGTVFIAAGNPSDLPRTPPDDTLDFEVISSHPEVISINAATAVSRAAVTVEKRERIPDLALTPFFDSELDRRAVGVGIAFELPLWNHNKGNVDKSRNALLEHEAQREMLLLELRSDLVEFEASCEAGAQVAASYRDRILPQVSSVAQTVERTYQLGEASLFEVLSATHALIETRLQFVSAALNAQIACSRLAAMKGDDL